MVVNHGGLVSNFGGTVQNNRGEVQNVRGQVQNFQGAVHNTEGTVYNEGGGVMNVRGTVQNIQGNVSNYGGIVGNAFGSVFNASGACKNVGGKVQNLQGFVDNHFGTVLNTPHAASPSANQLSLLSAAATPTMSPHQVIPATFPFSVVLSLACMPSLALGGDTDNRRCQMGYGADDVAMFHKMKAALEAEQRHFSHHAARSHDLSRLM